MNDKVSISVVIPVYNGERFIGPCIESVLNQTVQPAEIIIINDGSTDRTAELIAQHFDWKVSLFSRENKGRSASRNEGLRRACGDYVAFLDADDFFFPKHLELLTKGALEAGGEIVFDAKTTVQDAGERPVLPPSTHDGVDTWRHLYRCKIPIQCCMVCRRWVLDHNIAFDDDLYVSEDSLFLKKMILLGATAKYVRCWGTLYNLHEDQTTHDIYAALTAQRHANERFFEFIQDRGVVLSHSQAKCIKRMTAGYPVVVLLAGVYFKKTVGIDAALKLIKAALSCEPVGGIRRIRCCLATLWLLIPLRGFKRISSCVFGKYVLRDINSV